MDSAGWTCMSIMWLDTADEPSLKLTQRVGTHGGHESFIMCFRCREVGRHFVNQRSGSILIIGSTATYTLYPGEISYRVPKRTGPLYGRFVCRLAPFSVRVNMITPGLFITRMTENLDFKGETLKGSCCDSVSQAGQRVPELAPAACPTPL